MPVCSDGWVYDSECCDLVDPDAELIAKQSEIAAEILWRASGMRYGLCEVTVRACVKRCHPWGAPYPYKGADGAWRNLSGCGCIENCSCTELTEVVLDGPVDSIVEVLIDGDPVPDTDYRLDLVDGGWRLIQVAGEKWPACQDMTANCAETGSFCVTYNQGIAVDALGNAALSELVCNLTKACLGQPCLLPRNVQSVVRRGVAVTFDTDSGSWLYALPNVSAWLNSVNPQKLASASSVWSPDLPQKRVMLPPVSS